VFIPAPFELDSSGGAPAWQPSDEYVVVRTLFHALCGKQAIGALALENDSVAVIFDNSTSSCIVAWTWRDQPVNTPVELYLGPTPDAIDLWGRRQPTEIVGRRTHLRLTPLPLIVQGVDASLVLLQASFRVEPALVQLHDPEPRPVLSFRNCYDERITGQVRLEPPTGWELAQRQVPFDLSPGQTFEQALMLTVPPRQAAARHKLSVQISIESPKASELEFVVPLAVGLRNISVEGHASWIGDDLIVEQRLRNLSNQPVSFAAFCQAPARARAEQEFLNVAPGKLAVRAYRFVDARELSGLTVHLGIEEIRGERSLDQLVEVPP
jgi:hypothetical protein